MWDPNPYIDVLTQAAPAAVRAAPGLQDFILQTVLSHGQRRPAFITQVASDIPSIGKGFVYDRGSGLIFFGAWADHERTAAALMALRELHLPLDWEHASEQPLLRHGPLADRYLEDGYGFIANSPSLTQASGEWPLNVGSDVLLSPQEKLWFRALVVRYR